MAATAIATDRAHSSLTLLSERVETDILRSRKRRGVNAALSILLATVEICLSIASVVATTVGDYRIGSVAGTIVGVSVAIDQTLRIREHAGEEHTRILMLRGIQDQIRHPERVRDPLWNEYRMTAQSQDIDYLEATYDLFRVFC